MCNGNINERKANQYAKKKRWRLIIVASYGEEKRSLTLYSGWQRSVSAEVVSANVKRKPLQWPQTIGRKSRNEKPMLMQWNTIRENRSNTEGAALWKIGCENMKSCITNQSEEASSQNLYQLMWKYKVMKSRKYARRKQKLHCCGLWRKERNRENWQKIICERERNFRERRKGWEMQYICIIEEEEKRRSGLFLLSEKKAISLREEAEKKAFLLMQPDSVRSWPSNLPAEKMAERKKMSLCCV